MRSCSVGIRTLDMRPVSSLYSSLSIPCFHSSVKAVMFWLWLLVSGESILGDVTVNSMLSGDPVVGVHLLLDSSSHSSCLRVSCNHPMGVLGFRFFLIDSSSSRRTVSDGSWSRSEISWRVWSDGSVVGGCLARHSTISGEVFQLKILALPSPLRSSWFQSAKRKYDYKSFLTASGRCGVWGTLVVYVCLQPSPNSKRRGTSVSERLWYRSTTLWPAVHRVSPYFLRVISPDHRRTHCSLEMSGHGGSMNLATLPREKCTQKKPI